MATDVAPPPQEGACSWHREHFLRAWLWCQRETALLSPTGHLKKVILSCLGDTTDLLYIQIYIYNLGRGERERKLGQVRRQRNMFPGKEQDKIPEEELNKTNTSCLSDKRFKVMAIKMFTKLRWTQWELQKTNRNCNKAPNRSYSWTESILKGFNSILDKWASLVAQRGKKLPAAQETWVPSLGSIPGLERSPGEGDGLSTPVFLPEDNVFFHGQRSLAGYHRVTNTTEKWLRLTL